MVKVKDTPWEEDDIDLEQWLQLLAKKGYLEDLTKIRSTCTLASLASGDKASETGISCLQQGLGIADILADLEVDEETLMAAIIFGAVHGEELSLDDVEEQLGHPIAKLVKGVKKMNAIQVLQAGKYPQDKLQIDNVRRMLLAMVDDARVVLIKLAERLFVLRTASQLPKMLRQQIATEVMEIYAPLANRLGIGGIKWEMEDLAFRYLHSEEYQAIAKGLKTKRLERDKYVYQVVDVLKKKIKERGIQHFDVYGRSKHIHSIYRKMKRKNVSLDEIYDATALRVLVDSIEDCYTVLSIVHSEWTQIPQEFDDYIANPKANGYQSLHTAVIGPQNWIFEVQIRTFKMHDLAEMGVAAHWKYKENIVKQKESHERKIEWLRDILAWHKEMAGASGSMDAEFLEDRVYVFTPNGDVLDLPNGATPLDFAYYVHSRLGHYCRGAKINGAIVPLTYPLKTGDRVEVLTSKEERPSRDWLNPHLGYLKTTRAKAKVLHWFKLQDYDKNKAEGTLILEKEFKNLNIKNAKLPDIATHLQFKTADDLLAALGRGDIKFSQILHRIKPQEINPELPQNFIKQQAKSDISGNDLHIEGVGRLLTSMARCCQPLPGDDIIGYITLGRGVSVHRRDCPNIIHASEKQKQRFLQVSWDSSTSEHYLVDLVIKAFDRTGLLKDLTSLLANEKASVFSLNTDTNKNENIACLRLTLEVDGLTSLSRLLNKIEQIPNVFEARRVH